LIEVSSTKLEAIEMRTAILVLLLTLIPAANAGEAAVPEGAALPEPPLPAPVVPEIVERGLRAKAIEGRELGEAIRVVKKLNEEFDLKLGEFETFALAKRMEQELYPRLGWVAKDVETLLLEVNRFLGLGIDEVALVELAMRTEEEMRRPFRDCDPGPPPGEPVLKWADESANTAEDLSGSVLVLVTLVKGPDDDSWDNDWPWYHRSEAIDRATKGIKFLKGKAPSQANVSYEVRYYSTTTHEHPTNHRHCGEAWMDTAFARLGYDDWDSDGQILDDVAIYIRDLFNKDNCVIIFVPREEGRSYACRGGYYNAGGPNCTTFYYDPSSWVWRTDYTVYAHEMGHLFGACDEYYQESDDSGCNIDDGDDLSGEACDDPCKLVNPDFKFPGYCLNRNCEKPGLSGCDDMVDCLMKYGDETICTHTREQFGWHDYDNDDIIDAIDGDPEHWGPECNNGIPEVTPPVSSVTSLDIRQISSPFTVSWSGTDACDGVANYDIQFKDGDGSWSWWLVDADSTSADFTGFDWHTYYFRSRAEDGFSNNEDWPASGHDTYTTVMISAPPAPSVSSTSHPSELNYYSDNDPEFSWTVSTPSNRPLSELFSGYSYCVTRSSSASPDYTSETVTTSKKYYNWAEGTWYFNIRAMDKTGTWGPVARRKFMIDTEAPAAPVVSSPTHPLSNRYYSSGAVSVSWTPPADSSGIQGYSYTYNQTHYTTPDEVIDTYTTTKSFVVPDDGTWYFHVRAVDNTGNWGKAKHYKFQVDRVAPDAPHVSCSSHGDHNKWYSDNDPEFSWTIPVDDFSGTGGFSFHESATSTDMPDTISEGYIASTIIYDVPDGVRYFHIIAGDRAIPVNTSPTATHYMYRVDTTDPDTVTNLQSPSHADAIGQYNYPESSDNTVEVTWTAATDPTPGSGVNGYSIAWDHSASTVPDATIDIGGGQTSTVSGELDNATNWYFHIRSCDAAGNWDDEAVHIGPFYIDKSPPAAPIWISLTPGNSTVSLDWADSPEPDAAGYNLFRSTSSGHAYTQLNTQLLTQSNFTDNAVLNGIDYFYVITAVDSAENESGYSIERTGMPEYSTPGNGQKYNLTNLVGISNNGVTGSAPTFTMNGTVTITWPDTLVVNPGETLRSSDYRGRKKLLINGTLIADGTTSGGTITFDVLNSLLGDWGGIELLGPGPATVIDSCIVQNAVVGIYWDGGNGLITHSTIRWNSSDGIFFHGNPNGFNEILENTICCNDGDGIDILGESFDTLMVMDNDIYYNGGDGIEYAFVSPWSPSVLDIGDNYIYRNDYAGITCGQGGSQTYIHDNDIRENKNGIVMAGYTWGARPLIAMNNIQANDVSGVSMANQAYPILDNNTIVGNLVNGVLCATDSWPILLNNTITTSKYGVYIHNYTWGPYPDLGSFANGSGNNTIHGHTSYSVYNATQDTIPAHFNWWGSTTTTEMGTLPPPPMLGNVTAIYDGWDNVMWGTVRYGGWLNLGNIVPTITITQPSSPVVADTAVTIIWTASDPEENAQINLYYDTDTTGLDGSVISGGSGLSEDTAPDTLVWHTATAQPGTFYVYGTIDDGWETSSSYCSSSITIDYGRLSISPDSLDIKPVVNDTVDVPLTLRNPSANFSVAYACTVIDTNLAPVFNAVVVPDTGSIAASDSEEVVIRVVGSTTGNRSAYAKFTVPATGHEVLVEFDVSVSDPNIVLIDSTHNYGSTSIGSTLNWYLEAKNTGIGDLVVSNMSSTDTAFYVSGASWPDTIAAGDTSSYQIVFDPVYPGSSSAQITVMSNDPDHPEREAYVRGYGIGPDIDLTGNSHDFGTALYGSVLSWQFGVANTGSGNLNVSNITSNHADYQVISPSFPDTVVPGDTSFVSVTYTATALGSTGATLTVTSNDTSGSPLYVSLTGECVKPTIDVSDATHDFGFVRVDETESWTISVRNDGTYDLYLEQISGDNSDYSLVSPTLPDTLAPAESTDVVIGFTPFSTGASTDTLEFTSNDSTGSPVYLVVSGTGGVPSISVADTSHDFGGVNTSGYSDWDLTIRNTGTVSVTVDSIIIGIAEFTVMDSLPADVAAGDSSAFTIRFSPALAESSSSSADIYSNDIDNPVMWVDLDGLGLEPDINISHSYYNFGDVLLGTDSDWGLKIKNDGDTELVLESATIDDSVYTIMSPVFPDTLVPSDSIDIMIRFSPVEEWTWDEMLSITSNDPDDTLSTAYIVGSGVWPDLFHMPRSIEAIVFENSTVDSSLYIRNIGSGEVAFQLSESDTVLAKMEFGPPDLDRRGGKPALLGAKAERNPSFFAASGAYASAGNLGWTQGQATGMYAGVDDRGWVGGKSSGGAYGAINKGAFAKTDIPWLSEDHLSDTLSMGESDLVGLGLDATVVTDGVFEASLKLSSTDPETALHWIPIKMRVPRMRFADHDAGSVYFTITDEGCYGFYDAVHQAAHGEGDYGNGFGFKGKDRALFHGAFWAGTDTAHVSDGSYHYDWEVKAGGELEMLGLSTQFGTATFDDSNAPAPLGITVMQRSIAFATAPDDDYVIMDFEVVNTSVDSIHALYAAMYLDWDIEGYNYDAGGYSSAEAVGYMLESTTPDSAHYGVCMLEPSAPAAFHLVHNPTYIHPTGDIADSIKYRFMSDAVIDTATWENTDWSIMMSSGPYNLAVGDTAVVAFAILGGSNLADLKSNAAQARAKYPVGVAEASLACLLEQRGIEIAWSAPGYYRFDIRRSEKQSGEYKTINSAPIVCSSRCSYFDDDVWPGYTYFYKLYSDDRLLAGPIEVVIPTRQVAGLFPNYPNPFNPQTTIEFDIDTRGYAAVVVYNLNGRMVRKLFEGEMNSGHKSLIWDGRDDHGVKAGSGVYFCKLISQDGDFSRKLVLLK
jgi:parallel beta-helix repeat protein